MNNIKNEFSRCLRLFVLIYLLSEYNSLILSISIQTKTGKIKEIEINKNGELTIMDCSSDSINVIIDVQIGWRITISFSFYYLRLISGGIVLDGYSYPISDSADSFWIKNNNKILANGNEYNLEDKQLSFTITEDSDLLQYQHTYFEPQFICSSNSIMINDNNSYILNFNIQSKDSNNTKKAEKVEIYWEESIRGNVFSENLQITNYMVIQNNGQIEYQPTISGIFSDGYVDKIYYYVYRNIHYKDSDLCSFTIIRCGDNCEQCDKNTECLKCFEGYSFVEYDRQKCVNTNEFLIQHVNYYYEAYNNVLWRCYESCETCYDSSYSDSYGVHHNCNTCSINYPYSVITGIFERNCLSSCESLNLYQLDNEFICVDSCTNNYRYTYIDISGNKHCLYECRDLTRSYGQYRLWNTYTCVDLCTNDYPFQMGDTFICLQSCSFEVGYPYYVEGTNICLAQCPNDRQ